MSKGLGAKGPLAGIFRMTIKEQTKPVFEEVEKEKDEWVVTNTAQDFTFDILDISFDTYEYRGDTIDKMIISCDIDREAPVKLEMNVKNGIAQSIINTLSSVENLPGRTISLNVYTSKSGYASVYIEVDGEKAGWKYDGDAVKGIYGKPERWVSMAKKHITPQFENFTPAQPEDVFAQPVEIEEPQRTKPTPEPVEENTEDDLPF
jgi:hypothetical protein